MEDDPHKTYRRRHRTTDITERRVYRTVTGLRRRVNWRLRELGITLPEALRRAGDPMRVDSLWHTIGRWNMDRKTFELLTEILEMDEVDGWDRPWPPLPPASERVSLVDRLRDKLTAEGPGED